MSSTRFSIPSGLGLARAANRVVALLLVAALVVSWIWLVRDVVVAVGAEGTLDYGEPFVLNAAIHLDALYRPVADYPYLVQNYPPLYPVLVNLAHLAVPDVFAAGRLVSAIALLLAAGLLYRFIRDHGAHRSFALLAASLFALSPIAEWGWLARVDALALLFSVAALMTVHRSADARSAVLAGCLTAAALLTKQTMLAAPIAIVVWLALERGRGAVVRYLGSALAVGGVGLAGLLLWSDGEAWHHLVTYNVNVFQLHLLVGSFQLFLLRHPVVVGTALAGLLLLPRRHRMVKFYFVAAVLVAASVGKIGSRLNYFLPALWASACLSGLVADQVLRRRTEWMGSVRRMLGRAALLAGFGVQVLLYANAPLTPRASWTPVREFLAGREGPILTEDAGFSLRLGRDVWYQPFILRQLYADAADPFFDESPVAKVERQLARGQLGTVVMEPHTAPRQRWSDGQLDAIDRCYSVVFTADPYAVLEPAPRCRAFDLTARAGDVRRRPD